MSEQVSEPDRRGGALDRETSDEGRRRIKAPGRRVNKETLNALTARLRIPPLLRDRTFRRYWSASSISYCGDQISGIAVPLTAVLVLRANAAQMGYLTALEWLPSLLFGLHLGAWADRWGRRRITMMGADLGRAALWTSVPACYALHVLSLPLLFAVTFAAGVLSVLFDVSNGALFVSVVPADRYVDGQSLLYGSRALSFTGGPSLGGVLVQVLSAPFTVLFDAMSFVGSAFFLGRIRPVEPPVDEGGKGSVTAGARFIAGNGIVRWSLIAIATVNFFNLMFNALYVLYAVRLLHIKPAVLGVLIGIGALGGIGGALVTKRVAARIGIGRAYTLGCLLFTAPLLLWPLAGGPRLLVLMTLLVAESGCGFGVMMLDISIAAIFSAVIPDTLRSRVTGAFTAVNYGTRPLGALLGGLVAAGLGLRPAMWIATAGGVAGACLLLLSPLPGYRLPSRGGEPA